MVFNELMHTYYTHVVAYWITKGKLRKLVLLKIRNGYLVNTIGHERVICTSTYQTKGIFK